MKIDAGIEKIVQLKSVTKNKDGLRRVKVIRKNSGPKRICPHLSVELDENTREATCLQCERAVDLFDYIVGWANDVQLFIHAKMEWYSYMRKQEEKRRAEKEKRREKKLKTK